MSVPPPAPAAAAAAQLNPDDYDRYGFRKDSQYVTRADWDKANAEIDRHEIKQTAKWDQVLASNKGRYPERSDKIKHLIRKGVPNSKRREVWLHYSGAGARLQANPGVYLAMLERERANLGAGISPANEHIDIIERDLHRTFPDNAHFRSTPVVRFPSAPYPSAPGSLVHSLRRVLVAFSFQVPEIGYCQSLNYIAGLLLLFMAEEEAFWTLVVMTCELLPEGMYSRSLSGTITEMKVFQEVVKDKCKGLVAAVKQGGIIDLDMLVSPWFLTIYVNVLPAEAAVRTWDCFFYEGTKILYRIALAILKLIEDDVVKLRDPMEAIQYIQHAPKRMADAEKLLKTSFLRFGTHAVGKLSHHDIDARRERQQLLSVGPASPASRRSTDAGSSYSGAGAAGGPGRSRGGSAVTGSDMT